MPFISESIVPYTLSRLAPGSYDLWLDGEIIGSIVEELQTGKRDHSWYAELLDGRPSAGMPPPFTTVEHAFESLGAVQQWLGGADIQSTSNE